MSDVYLGLPKPFSTAGKLNVDLSNLAATATMPNQVTTIVHPHQLFLSSATGDEVHRTNGRTLFQNATGGLPDFVEIGSLVNGVSVPAGRVLSIGVSQVADLGGDFYIITGSAQVFQSNQRQLFQDTGGATYAEIGSLINGVSLPAGRILTIGASQVVDSGGDLFFTTAGAQVFRSNQRQLFQNTGGATYAEIGPSVNGLTIPASRSFTYTTTDAQGRALTSSNAVGLAAWGPRINWSDGADFNPSGRFWSGPFTAELPGGWSGNYLRVGDIVTVSYEVAFILPASVSTELTSLEIPVNNLPFYVSGVALYSSGVCVVKGITGAATPNPTNPRFTQPHVYPFTSGVIKHDFQWDNISTSFRYKLSCTLSYRLTVDTAV